MIPKICNLCETQVVEKLASFYWAWNGPSGHRTAYKQALCVTCVRERFAQLIATAEQPVLICPGCGIGTVDDYEAVYLTYCLPGMPMGTSEMPLCAACAATVREQATTGSIRLENRGVGVGGPQPEAPTANAVWNALGLKPEGNGR